MERNLTQSEFEAINARRAKAGKDPLTYRDANRQARRLTSRQRTAAAASTGRGPQETSSGEPSQRPATLPPTPPRSRRQEATAEDTYTSSWDSWNDWGGQDWWWNWGSSSWWDWRWRENPSDQAHQEQERQQDGNNEMEVVVVEDPEEEVTSKEVQQPEPEVSSMEAASSASASDRQVSRTGARTVEGENQAINRSATSTSGDRAGLSFRDITVDPISLFNPHLSEADLPEDAALNEKISKLLTACIRHKPQDFGLNLDEDGFADLEEVARLRSFRKYGVSPRMLAAVAAQISKKRFIFHRRESQILVAASHGHSQGILRSLRIFQILDEETAPEQAFHATRFRFWNSISSTGLQRMDREHIHLAYSADQESGLRQGQDILLVIQAKAVAASGILLLRSETGVLLTPGITSGGLLPLHFISEARNLRTNQLHFIPPKAGEWGSLLLEEGRLPPMPIAPQGGPSEWNDPAIWSNVRSKTRLNLQRLSISLNPAQLVLSFLIARGLKQIVVDQAESKIEAGEVWRGLRILGTDKVGDDLETFYHGTHLYALSSILWKGLRPSTSQGGTRTLHIGDMPLDGVYSFTDLQQGLFYCPYILLPLSAQGKTPTTVAVRVSLELKVEPNANRRRGKKTNQYILEANKVQVYRIWIQASSPDQLQLGDSYTEWHSTLEAPL